MPTAFHAFLDITLFDVFLHRAQDLGHARSLVAQLTLYADNLLAVALIFELGTAELAFHSGFLKRWTSIFVFTCGVQHVHVWIIMPSRG
jgi:hypothetical protein